MKKVNEGDMSVMSEYLELADDATKFSSTMEEAQSEGTMSASQAARMLKIQAKLTKALY